jgi:large subunit ribosomal protein L23
MVEKKMIFDIIKRPRVGSTKVVKLNKENKQKIVVDVYFNANKIQIRKAVELLFDVKVISVNTIIVKGKNKRVAGRHNYKTSSYKKAIITLDSKEDVSQLEVKGESVSSANLYNNDNAR